MTVYYVKSGSGALAMQNRAWSNGDRMVPDIADASSNVATGQKWVWETTTAGTSNGTPTWPSSATQDVTTVTQNGVVWTARRPGYSSGTTANWTYATIFLKYAGVAVSANDTIYVSNNHAESVGAAYVCSPAAAVNVICANDGAAPPTAVATTATVTTTGGSSITCAQSASYFYGLTFICGSGSSSTCSIAVAGTYEQCSFQNASTFAGGGVGASSATSTWINCSIKFGHASQSVNGSGILTWTGGSLLAGGTSPTAIFTQPAASCLIEDVDFSNASAGVNLTAAGGNAQSVIIRNVKLPTSWSGALNSSTPGSTASNGIFSMQNVDNAGTNYRLGYQNTNGSIVQDTSIYNNAGANNGTTHLSWKLVSNASAALFPAKYLITPEIVGWNTITGSSINARVEVVHDSATALNNDEIWLEVSYLGTSGAPLGTLITNAKADVLASAGAQPTSTATWTGTGGFSNPNKQYLQVSFVPQIAGFIHARVKLCKATKTVYVDPKVTLSQ